jgi:DNA-directed RNA polymerase subunit RPC12/RpoP
VEVEITELRCAKCKNDSEKMLLVVTSKRGMWVECKVCSHHWTIPKD